MHFLNNPHLTSPNIFYVPTLTTTEFECFNYIRCTQSPPIVGFTSICDDKD